MNYCSLEYIDYWYKQMDGMVEQFCKSKNNPAGFDRRIEGFCELADNATDEEKENWQQELNNQEAKDKHEKATNIFDPIKNTNSFFN